MRSSVVAAHGLSSCRVQALGHAGFSSSGSRPLEHRLSSCGTRAQLLCGMWDLPGPGIEPVSPALTGRLPTTVPPGKSNIYFLNVINAGMTFPMNYKLRD